MKADAQHKSVSFLDLKMGHKNLHKNDLSDIYQICLLTNLMI